MLAKVLPKGGEKAPQTVHWPSVDGKAGEADGSHTSAENQLARAEALDLRREVEALRAELANTRADAERRINEALAGGRREGEAAARQSLEPQVSAEISKLRDLLRDVLAAGAKLRAHAEEDLVRLAVAIARRILHREVTVDADAIIGLVKAAFQRLDLREVHQVRTDPDSLNTIKEVLRQLGAPASVKVAADPSLRLGSLVIESSRGTLEASIDSQLQEIQRGFIDIVNDA
ncbi:MAG TPA: FliH/SctL family protein [Bryobacteraceae bacterium]|nr:FliH/SctL family protein [Bryobacteraceae bacterium]